jgi:methylenetetrahydrofolate reductase (NADPH)
MGRISIELVPREKAQFISEIKTIKKEFPGVDTLNIPDILKFDMRIPEACGIAAPFFENVIPHIRAVSVNREQPLSFAGFFRGNNIREVLVILGDNPEIVSKSGSPCDSIELIRKIKKEMPDIIVYGGLDPYRSTVAEELDYVHRKVDAGCDGFFTQPFFDIRLMDTWIRNLPDTKVFWGLAPVIRESARKYWENDNNVFFPDKFETTLKWNRDFARDVLEFIEQTNSNVYFMPITVDIIEYLKGVIQE